LRKSREESPQLGQKGPITPPLQGKGDRQGGNLQNYSSQGGREHRTEGEGIPPSSFGKNRELDSPGGSRAWRGKGVEATFNNKRLMVNQIWRVSSRQR